MNAFNLSKLIKPSALSLAVAAALPLVSIAQSNVGGSSPIQFASLDEDGNNALDETELNTFANQYTFSSDELIERYDTDNDSQLDPVEFGDALAAMGGAEVSVTVPQVRAPVQARVPVESGDSQSASSNPRSSASAGDNSAQSSEENAGDSSSQARSSQPGNTEASASPANEAQNAEQTIRRDNTVAARSQVKQNSDSPNGSEGSQTTRSDLSNNNAAIELEAERSEFPDTPEQAAEVLRDENTTADDNPEAPQGAQRIIAEGEVE